MAGRGARFDVIVVLGGPEDAMKRRTAHGVSLFKAGMAERILLSGGGGRRRPEAETMRDLALAAKVPPAHLVLELDSLSTLENAIHSARIMRAEDWRTALVVTDSLHLPRALLAFRVAGVRASGSATAWPWREALLSDWFKYAFYETVGLGWYLLLILGGRHRRIAQALAAKSSKPSTAARS
jgi:uncharacterized SAM-binding protein YcdF (DUF218 family)